MSQIDKTFVGYATPWSVSAGRTLAVHVSSHPAPADLEETLGYELEANYADQIQVELVRLLSGDSRPRGTGFVEQQVVSNLPEQIATREQRLFPGSFAELPNLPELNQFTLALLVMPTTPHLNAPVVATNEFTLGCQDGVLILSLTGVEVLRCKLPLKSHRWHELVLRFDALNAKVSLDVVCLGQGVGEPARLIEQAGAALEAPKTIAAGCWLLGAAPFGLEAKSAQEAPPHNQPAGQAGFNGRLESPVLLRGVHELAYPELMCSVPALVLGLADASDLGNQVVAAWDFAQMMETDQVPDVGGSALHGRLHQTPTRAVRGRWWDGSVQQCSEQPAHYRAIHFHSDDLTDAGWLADIEWEIPKKLASGVYAVKLMRGTSEDYVPFFVSPAAGAKRAPVALLASTASYLAYANQRVSLTGDGDLGKGPRDPHDRYLLAHPEVGLSLYEHHEDGSGVHYSSGKRPVLNMKPKTLMWSFNADTNLLAWLHALEQPFDVITDQDLHREGATLLNHYSVVVTGTHPEYYSTDMLDGVEAWLEQGGRLMYMGGNGFYWRIAFDPQSSEVVEVRRAEDGTRAWASEPGEYCHAFNGEYGGLWRRQGRAPNLLVGVGFAAQGFDGGTYYRWQAAAADARIGFMLEGVDTNKLFGGYGTQGGGAAGEEIDRFDLSLGSPEHALVVASSEGHRPGMLRVKEEFLMMKELGGDPEVRADMTFFETPAGGAVFSTGSISYAGALSVDGYDNDVARLTANVLRRFIDATPFHYPA